MRLSKFSVISAGILAFVSLFIVPRVVDVTRAHDCYSWNTGNCSSRNTPQYIDSYVIKDHQDNSWFQSPAYIQQSYPMAQNGNCSYSTGISWSVPGSSNATVTVLNPDTNQEQTFATGSSGTQTADWIQPNKAYRFTLWDQNHNQVAQTWVSGAGSQCNAPAVAYTPSPTYSQQPMYYQQQNPSSYNNNYYQANNNYPSNPSSGNFLSNTAPFGAYQIVNGQVVSNSWPDDPLDRNIPPQVYYRFCPTFAPC